MNIAKLPELLRRRRTAKRDEIAAAQFEHSFVSDEFRHAWDQADAVLGHDATT